MRLHLILAATLAACGAARPGDAPAIRPADSPPRPAGPEPALPAIPAAVDGCVDPGEQDVAQSPVWLDIARYDDAWLARGLARRGWTELAHPQFVYRRANAQHPGFDIVAGDVYLRARGPHVLEDEHGQRYIRTRLRYQCMTDEPRFVVDGRGGVFEITPAPRCGETREVRLCGGLAVGGCGVEPGPQDPRSLSEWWFVAAPSGAHWLGIAPVAIDDPVPTCFRALPKTVSKPP